MLGVALILYSTSSGKVDALERHVWTYKMGSVCFTTHVNPRVSVYLLFNLDVFYFARQYIRPYGP